MCKRSGRNRILLKAQCCLFRTGPNHWRDSVRPRKILFDVCKRNNLPVPELIDDHTIKIGESVFRLEDFGALFLLLFAHFILVRFRTREASDSSCWRRRRTLSFIYLAQTTSLSGTCRNSAIVQSITTTDRTRPFRIVRRYLSKIIRITRTNF